MTQKEATLLVEIITKVVRRELSSFKKQLLNEGYSPLRANSVSKQHDNSLVELKMALSDNSQPRRVSNKRYSSDYLLNSILQESTPMPKEGSKEELDMMEEAYERMNSSGLNLPTGERGGLMHTGTNVDHVIQAMNKDYSGMFKPKQQLNQNSRDALRSSYAAMLAEEEYISRQPRQQQIQRPNPVQNQILNGYPSVEPFSGEEEDLTWLNEVQ